MTKQYRWINGVLYEEFGEPEIIYDISKELDMVMKLKRGKVF